MNNNQPMSVLGANLAKIAQPRLIIREAKFYGTELSAIIPGLICSISAAIMIYRGNLQLAGYLFWGLFGLFSCFFISHQLIYRRPHLGFITLLIGVSPMINYLRSIGVPYNIVVVVLFAGLMNFLFITPTFFKKELFKNKLLILLLIFELIYYVLAFITTKSYSVHLRAFEMVFAAQLIFLLIDARPDLAKASLLGNLFSSLLLATSMMPYLTISTRLGIGRVDDVSLGNPITLGLPLALGFLALLVDKGTWLGLANHNLWRYILIVPTTLFLALTASRASWLVVLIGMVIALIIGRHKRVRLVIGIILVVVSLIILLQTPQGSEVVNWFTRTTDANIPLYKRTSGRSDQWIVGWYAFKDSINSIVGGYGAGLGPEVYAYYSPYVEEIRSFVGGEMAWHALFLQIGIELGLLGLIPYLSWLLAVGLKLFRKVNLDQYILPFSCFGGFLVIITTVSGYASIPGFFLGISLWGTYHSSQKRVGNH